MKDNQLGFNERLFDKTGIGLLFLDCDLNIVAANDAACRYLGLDKKDFRGKPIEAVVPDYRRKFSRKILKRVIELKKSFEYRFRIYSDGEEQRVFLVFGEPIAEDDGTAYILVWIKDITRHSRLERRLRRVDRFYSLIKMAGGVAHYFNSILGGMVTAIDFALESRDPIVWKKTLELLSDGVNRATELTRKLMEFSVRHKVEHNLADLTEVIISFVDRADKELSKKGISIDLKIKAIPILAINPQRFTRILEILLANSVQAIGDFGGAITVIVDRDEGYVRIVFADNGPGIPREYVDRVFDPFFTTKAGSSADSYNLGLGLTIAKKLAEDAGGDILYTPEDNPYEKGACFTVVFPVTKRSKEDIYGEGKRR